MLIGAGSNKGPTRACGSSPGRFRSGGQGPGPGRGWIWPVQLRSDYKESQLWFESAPTVRGSSRRQALSCAHPVLAVIVIVLHHHDRSGENMRGKLLT